MHVSLLTSYTFSSPENVFLKDLGTISLKGKQWRKYYPYLPKSEGEEEPNLNGCQLTSTDSLIAEKTICKVRNNSVCSTHLIDQPTL